MLFLFSALSSFRLGGFTLVGIIGCLTILISKNKLPFPLFIPLVDFTSFVFGLNILAGLLGGVWQLIGVKNETT